MTMTKLNLKRLHDRVGMHSVPVQHIYDDWNYITTCAILAVIVYAMCLAGACF